MCDLCSTRGSMLGTRLLDDEAALFGFPDEHSNSNRDHEGHKCKAEGRCAPGDAAGLERKCKVAAQNDRHGLTCEDERLPQTADITRRFYTQGGAQLLAMLSLKTPTLNANARLPPSMTAKASPVKIRACPRLHAVARVDQFMAQALFTLSTNAQPLILNLDVPMPECAVEALHRTEVWEGFPESRMWWPKGPLAEPVRLKDSSPDALGRQQIGHQRD